VQGVEVWKGEALCGDVRSRYEGMIWRSVQRQTQEDCQKNKKRAGMNGSGPNPVALPELFCCYDVHNQENMVEVCL
jgi:hypothetical protein